jgi:hypothetical protein
LRLDGLLRVLDPAALAPLPAPWSAVAQADEIVIEIKMVGDHLDLLSFDRALLRRLARQVMRREAVDDPFDGEVPLWFVAPHVPAVMHERRTLTALAPGCYQVGPAWLASLWIAANELPLADELVPFLIARSGRPLDAFVRWVMTRRPTHWLTRMLEYLPMSTAAEEELRNYTFPRTNDQVLRARQRQIGEWALESSPELGESVEARGMRKMLRDVLDARGLRLDADDEKRIEACADLATLRRWAKQAAVAASTAEALR